MAGEYCSVGKHSSAQKRLLFRRSKKSVLESHAAAKYHALIAGSKRFKDYFLIPLIRYDNLRGAAFEDSPLVKKKDYFLFACALAYVF